MDGRTQTAVIDYIKANFAVDHVDMVTEPGPVKILAEALEQQLLDSIRRRCEISINRHASELIAVVTHHDCAGNPAPKEAKVAQSRAAVQKVKSWFPAVQVIALWVGDDWQARPVAY